METAFFGMLLAYHPDHADKSCWPGSFVCFTTTDIGQACWYFKESSSHEEFEYVTNRLIDGSAYIAGTWRQGKGILKWCQYAHYPYTANTWRQGKGILNWCQYIHYHLKKKHLDNLLTWSHMGGLKWVLRHWQSCFGPVTGSQASLLVQLHFPTQFSPYSLCPHAANTTPYLQLCLFLQ